MGTTFKPLYAGDVALTMTSLASLTNTSTAGCVVVDNTTNLYEDALVSVVVKTNTSSGTVATGSCTISAYGETDGTHYTDGVSGADATQTLTSPPNVKPIGILNCVANNTVYYSGPLSVARAFGGILPPKWGITVTNNTGATLAAAGSSADYIGVNSQIP